MTDQPMTTSAPQSGDERAARAYPIEAEEALEAWMAANDSQGIWVSPPGWWYAAWMLQQAEVERLKVQLAAQDEVIKAAQFVRSGVKPYTWLWNALALFEGQKP